jgi:hypothetical protein
MQNIKLGRQGFSGLMIPAAGWKPGWHLHPFIRSDPVVTLAEHTEDGPHVFWHKPPKVG